MFSKILNLKFFLILGALCAPIVFWLPSLAQDAAVILVISWFFAYILFINYIRNKGVVYTRGGLVRKGDVPVKFSIAISLSYVFGVFFFLVWLVIALHWDEVMSKWGNLSVH